MTFRRTAKFLAARQDPEVRARIRAACKASWADPDLRARQSAKIRAAWADPEVRARQSAVLTEVWADPELRARQAAKMKAALADPEVRARRRAKIMSGMTRAREVEALSHFPASYDARSGMMRARAVEVPRWVVTAGLQNVFCEVAAQSDEIDAARHCRLLTAEMRKARAAPGEEA